MISSRISELILTIIPIAFKVKNQSLSDVVNVAVLSMRLNPMNKDSIEPLK